MKTKDKEDGMWDEAGAGRNYMYYGDTYMYTPDDKKVIALDHTKVVLDSDTLVIPYEFL